MVEGHFDCIFIYTCYIDVAFSHDIFSILIISYHIMSYHIISYHIISYHIIPVVPHKAVAEVSKIGNL